MEQTDVTTQRQDSWATQRSETKRKIVKWLPSFTSQLRIQLRFLNSQARASNTQHFLLGKQQQFQAKHAKFGGGGVRARFFSILWFI